MNSSSVSEGVFDQNPRYKLFDNAKSDLVELIQREENKFFAERPLYVLSSLQMIFGAIIFISQVYLNNRQCLLCTNCYSNTGIWVGCVFVLVGLLSTLTTRYKLSSLLVISSFLTVLLYGVSIFSFIFGIIMTQNNQPLMTFSSPGGQLTNGVIYGITFVEEEIGNGHCVKIYAALAIISALNLIVSILISAFFCRAGCSCCQPRGPTIMYNLAPTVAPTTSVTVETTSGSLMAHY